MQWTGECMSHSTILAFFTVCGLTFTFWGFLPDLASNSQASFILLSTILWLLFTSMLHAQINMHSLMASSMSSNITTSLNISLVRSSSLSCLINCSLNSLSYFPFYHSTTALHSLPIHSWADSLLFLSSIQYCNEIIIWLWHGLNFLLRTEIIPFVVLHFSFPYCVIVFISNRPPLT